MQRRCRPRVPRSSLLVELGLDRMQELIDKGRGASVPRMGLLRQKGPYATLRNGI